MIIRTCNGCGRRVADDDADAIRDAQPGAAPSIDWCGGCVAIIRTELPRLAAQAREARRAAAAEPVRSRALRLWQGGPVVEFPAPRA